MRTASPQLSGVPSLMKRIVLVQPELVGGLGARAASGWPKLKYMQAGPTHSGGNAAAEACPGLAQLSGRRRAPVSPGGRAAGPPAPSLPLPPSHLAVALPAARMSKALPNAETKFVVEPVYNQTTSPQVGRMFSKYNGVNGARLSASTALVSDHFLSGRSDLLKVCILSILSVVLGDALCIPSRELPTRFL